MTYGLREAAEKAVHLVGNYLWNEDGEDEEWLIEAYQALNDALEAASEPRLRAAPNIEVQLDVLARELVDPQLGTDIRVERIRAALPTAFQEYRDWGIAIGRAETPDVERLARAMARLAEVGPPAHLSIEDAEEHWSSYVTEATDLAAEYARLAGPQP